MHWQNLDSSHFMGHTVHEITKEQYGELQLALHTNAFGVDRQLTSCYWCFSRQWVVVFCLARIGGERYPRERKERKSDIGATESTF